MALPGYQFTVQDEAGNIIPGAAVRVTLESDGSLSTLYTDPNGSVLAGNPVYSDADGFVYFHVASGVYKIRVTAAGYDRTLRYVNLGTAVTDGVTPGIKLNFNSADHLATDPGAGQFKTNNATFASITALYIDNADVDANAITAILDSWDDTGSSSNRGTLELRNTLTPSIFGVFTVTGSVVDSTGFRTISVTPVVGNGTWSDEFAMSFLRTGNTGAAGATGATGPTGTTGSTGATGPTGPSPAVTVLFDSGTSGDPGAGKFGFDNATLASVTSVRVDNVDAFGSSITAMLDSWDDGGNTSDRGVVEFRDQSDPSKFFVGRVTGSVADSTGYRTMSVAHVASAGPLSAECSMTFSRTGNTGASGAGTGDVVGPASATNGGIVLFDLTTGKLIRDSAVVISTDGTFASNADTKAPTEKAVKTYVDAAITAIKAGVSASFDTLAEIATELALKAYLGVAQAWTAPQRYSATALTASTAWNAGTAARLTAAVSTAFQIANPTGGTAIDGQIYTFEITYSGSGPLTWGSQFKGLSAITWTNTSGKKDRAQFQYNSANTEFEYVGHALDVRA